MPFRPLILGPAPPHRLGVLLWLTLIASHVHAEPNLVYLECPSLGTMQVAQLETRIRVLLLGDGADGVKVHVICSNDAARLDVERGDQKKHAEIDLRANDFDERVLAVIDDALGATLPKTQERQPKQASIPPDSDVVSSQPPAPKPPARSVLAAMVTLRPGYVVPQAAAPRIDALSPTSQSTEERYLHARNWISANAVAALWQTDVALGALVQVRRQRERILYGASIGGLVGRRNYRGFEPFEAILSTELGYDVPSVRLKLLVGAGLSLLYLHPDSSHSPDRRPYLPKPYAEVGVELPLWFETIGVVLGGGLRVFSANRRINADEQEELTLPILAPKAQLGVSYSW